MSVPYILRNSTSRTKYVIDADELNANFSYLDSRGGVDDYAVTPIKIYQGLTEFVFPRGIVLSAVDTYPSYLRLGMIFYHEGDNIYYCVKKDDAGNPVLSAMG